MPPSTTPPWSDAELDAIVADYFAMLAADRAGTPYRKADHRAALMRQIGRSKGSIEFKHQNISAVLDELGLPWIPGYKPKRNYQNAIFPAIERHLHAAPQILTAVPAAVAPPPDLRAIFVPVPPPPAARAPRPPGLERLVRKFDPVERDHRNRTLGTAGEQFVLDVEMRRLRDAGRDDLARQVRWVAAEDGDGAGYDIRSFDPAGDERWIEVKTTNGSAATPFYLTRTERAVSEDAAAIWRLYRVHWFSQVPKIFTLTPPLEQVCDLRAEVWRAVVR